MFSPHAGSHKTHVTNTRHRRYAPIISLSWCMTHTQEQILAVGRGFDWLHIPNKALIVGPYRFASHFRDMKKCFSPIFLRVCPPATILETQSPPPDHSYCRTFATAAFQSASVAPHAPHIITAHCRSSETKVLFTSHLQCIEMASALSDFVRSKKRNPWRDLLSALFAVDSKQGFVCQMCCFAFRNIAVLLFVLF